MDEARPDDRNLQDEYSIPGSNADHEEIITELTREFDLNHSE